MGMAVVVGKVVAVVSKFVRQHFRPPTTRIKRLTYLLHERPNIPKFLQHWFVSNRTNILDVVERLPLFLARHSSQRFPRVNTFQDAEPPKVLDGDLQHLDALRSTNETRLETGVFPLLLLAHARQFAFRARGRTQRRLDGRPLGAALDAIAHGDFTEYKCTVVVGSGGGMQMNEESMFSDEGTKSSVGIVVVPPRACSPSPDLGLIFLWLAAKTGFEH